MPKPNARDRIEISVTERLASLKGPEIFRGDYPRYVRTIDDNLVEGITRADFWEDLFKGAGGELQGKGNAPPKFCAAFSSSALVVNCFGPFRNSPKHLALLGHSDFLTAHFEKKMPTGLTGVPPHLDFFAKSDSVVVAVESKFTEVFHQKHATFRPSYDDLVEELGKSVWQELFSALKAEPATFKYLDAGQLLKHYLGLRHSIERHDCEITLLYLYWEPTNFSEIPEYLAHRAEVTDFSERVSDSTVTFLSMSYTELWSEWLQEESWPGLKSHVKMLQARYGLTV